MKTLVERQGTACILCVQEIDFQLLLFLYPVPMDRNGMANNTLQKIKNWHTNINMISQVFGKNVTLARGGVCFE